MSTTLHIDVDQTAPMHSGGQPRLNVRRHDGDELPPGDVAITIARSLPPHLIRHVLAEAADALTADTGPRRLKLGPTKRKALA